MKPWILRVVIGVTYTMGVVTGLMMSRSLARQSAQALSDWQPVTISSVGWSQIRSSITWGGYVENTNLDMAMVDIELEAQVFDGSGTLLRSSSEYLEWLGPGQRLGIGDDVFISEGQSASRLEVRVKQAKPRPFDSLIAETAGISVERFGSYVTGVIRNPYAKALSDVRVYALLFDANGSIIGSESTFISNLPANGTAAVRTSISDGVRAVRVELFPVIGALTKFGE